MRLLVANANALLGARMYLERSSCAGHFVLHVHADRVSRRVYREPVRPARALCAVRQLLPAPDRRPSCTIGNDAQFAASTSYRLDYANLAAGITIFAIGLFKKTVLADGIAPYASPVFEQRPAAMHRQHRGVGRRMCIRLQLYFDFRRIPTWRSGSRRCSASAAGQFESPYKATNIIEFCAAGT